MEFLGTVSDEIWSSIDPTMSADDSDMMAQIMLGACSIFPNQNNDHVYQNNDALLLDPTLYSYPTVHHHHNQGYVPLNFDVISSNPMPVDYCMTREQVVSSEPTFEIDPNYLLDDDQICQMEEISRSSSLRGKRMLDHVSNDEPTTATTTTADHHLEKEGNVPVDNQKPKRRARGAPKVENTTRTRRSNKKSQKNNNCKTSASNEQDGNVAAATNGQHSSSNCNSEDDSINGSSAHNNKGGRGSASDPQSLYARKRRERINERLKILQNLVPNGTKVDISTMLEEAVNYVKFLQLQIKLLSSDDLWMYAPLAYNGVDFGLNLHNILTLQK